MENVNTAKLSVMPYVIFTLAASFYLYEFILQVSPSVMTDGIMYDFKVGAAGLGFISAAYYYAYVPMQIPAGLLFDRFGPRILIFLAILLCVLGTFFFSMTDSVFFASLGRFMIGIGSAFSFVGTLVLASRWFAPRHYALLVGVAQALSSVGAILGEVPLAQSVTTWGWRTTMVGIGIVGLFLAFLVYQIVRDYPPGTASQHQQANANNEWQRLKLVCRQSQLWYIAAYAFFVWSPIIVFAALWGVPYMVLRYQISTEHAATMIAMIWIGIGIGSPFMGWWSDRISSRNIPCMISAALGVVSCVIILFFQLSLPAMYFLLLVFGFSASGQSVSFAIVKDKVSPNLVGTASGFNNMATVAGGLSLQPLIGVLLHYFWTGKVINGVPFYHTAAYQKSLIVLPLCYFIGFCLSAFFIKETHCQPQYKD